MEKDGALMERSARAEVRNPLVALPAAAKLAALPPEARAALEELLGEISKDCRGRANEAWKRHKAPMAAYWKANAVYARHMKLLLKGAA
jgi:hypothetical protein